MQTAESSKRLTISDIARLAGVAPSTVSEVVNNDPKSRVSRKTFEKVRQVIDAYNYVPSPQARALITRKTRQLGFLVSSTAMLGLANSYFSSILAGIELACAERDYRCMVSRYDLSSVHEFVMPAKLRQRSVDALLIAGRIEAPLDDLGIPVAVIGVVKSAACPQISSDMVTSLIEVYRYLAELGHRRLVLPYYSDSERQEREGALNKFNRESTTTLAAILTDDYRDSGDFFRGCELADLVHSDRKFEGCTALVANNQICCGFMQRFAALGHRFPEDFSVIADSDSQNCQWNTIPITACESNTFEHGYAAANLMIDSLEELKSKEEVKAKLQELYRPNPLIVRASSGRVPVAK